MSDSSYAVLFKTHFWDEFTARQLERMQKAVRRGDIYVVVDETMQPAPPIAYDKVLPIRNEDIEALQLARFTTHGSVVWYNVDYPHYIAMTKLPRYDYYVAVEYDVVIEGSLDAVIDRLAEDGVDHVGYRLNENVADWVWFPMHQPIYGDGMQAFLQCICIQSRRAMEHLLARRQAMALDFAAGRLEFWPICEAFLVNEVHLAGMQVGELQHYGNTDHYNWWPPHQESEAGAAAAGTGSDAAFLHPVLHGNRYVRSLLHHEPSLAQLLRPNAELRAKLAGFDGGLVRSVRRKEILRRVTDRLHKELERLNLKRRWYSDAQHQTQRSRQQPSAHNAG